MSEKKAIEMKINKIYFNSNNQNELGAVVLRKYSFVSIVVLGAIMSCNSVQDDGVSQKEDDSLSSEVSSLAEYFHTTPDQVQDKGDYYLVEGDIIVDKNQNPASILSKKSAVSLNFEVLPHDNWKASDICLYVAPSVRTSLGGNVSDFDDAINSWNKLYRDKKAAIRFSQSTTDAPNCIKVEAKYNSQVNAADPYDCTDCATYPSEKFAFGSDAGCFGLSGCGTTNNLYKQKVILSLDNYSSNVSSTLRKKIVMHELGHTLGLMHPNEGGGTTVPGTPAYEFNSVMGGNGNVASFTDGDIKAAAYMYPYNNNLYTSTTYYTETRTYCDDLIGAGQKKLLGCVQSFQHQTSPYRIAALTTDGALHVKESSQSGIWVEEHAGVRQYQISNERVGIITNDNVLKVKEGSLNAAWSVWNGYKKMQLEGNRIAALDLNNCLSVKEGVLGSSWPTEKQMCNVSDFFLEGDKIGVLVNGVIYIKQGSLTALWQHPNGFGGFTSFQMDGDRNVGFSPSTNQTLWGRNAISASTPFIGLKDQVKSYLIRDGRMLTILNDQSLWGKDGLNDAWVSLLGNVSAVDIRGQRIDAITTAGELYTKTGLNGVWTLSGRNAKALNSMP